MQQVGNYELVSQIGAGASGTVWKAHRQGPVPQVVALKRLRIGSTQVDLNWIRREATVLTELDHPHIVRVLEVLEDGDGIAVAMQLASGGSLEQILAERGRIAAGEVVGVAAPIADALASAHRRGIVHGDVKPANVLFTSDGEPLLSDFGVARTLGRLTSEHVAGTAEYIAPELLDGVPPDPRSDVYSLGVVCYEAITGHPPYGGEVPLAVIRAADAGIHEPLTDRWDVPTALAEVVEQAMARDPRRRFGSADELAWALRGSMPQEDIRLPGIAAAADGPDDALRGTRTFGPRPPRPAAAVVKRLRLPATFFVLIVAAGIVYMVRGPLRPEEVGCPEVQEPVVEPGGQIVAGDPEGDGCAAYGTYQLHTLQGGQQVMLLSMVVGDQQKRIGLGEPGDQLFLGDWNCDGTDTPGLYRRAVGELQYFDVWPEVKDQLHQPDRLERAPANADGKLEVARDPAEDADRCDQIVVTAEA